MRVRIDDSGILHAAIQELLDRDYRDVRLRDIARRAGRNLEQVERRFADCGEVLGALMDDLTDPGRWGLPPEPGLPAAARLELLVHRHLCIVGDRPELAAVVTRNVDHLADPFRRSFRRRAATYRARWIAAILAIAPGFPPPRMDAFVMGILETLGDIGLRGGDWAEEAPAFTAFALRTLDEHQDDVERAFMVFVDLVPA